MRPAFIVSLRLFYARARKNAADRESGLKRLEKRFRSDRLTKDKLNNRGYNRFLTMSGDATIKIDYVNPYDNKRKSVLLHTREEPELTELLDIISANC